MVDLESDHQPLSYLFNEAREIPRMALFSYSEMGSQP